MPSIPLAFGFGVYVIVLSAFTTTVPRRGGCVMVIVAPAGASGTPPTVSLASGLNVNGVAQLVAATAEQSSLIVYASLLATGGTPPPATPTFVVTIRSAE